MKTAPETMLAIALTLFGAAFGFYLTSTVKPYTPVTAENYRLPVPRNATVTCKMGQLLTQSTCQQVQTGTVTFRLNAGDIFSIPTNETARITVQSGGFKLTSVVMPGELFYGQGGSVVVYPPHVITVTQNQTTLLKVALN
jgi:hypothetical protein